MLTAADKRPRHYAAEILRLPEAERQAALARVPAELRDWVEFYVRDHQDNAAARHAVRSLCRRARQIAGIPALNARRAAIHREIQSNPDEAAHIRRAVAEFYAARRAAA